MTTKNHECYVSLEVAKLLKEAGFDWEVDACYTYGDYFDFLPRPKNCNEIEHWHSAPTLEVAQRWLREVKGYNVLVCHDFKWNKYGWWILQDNDMLCHNYETQFDTYEEALEAGIKKALEIILEKGE